MACLRFLQPGDEVMIATANGVIVRQQTDQISAQGRMATGVRLQQLAEDDSVMNVTPFVEGQADNEAGGGEE
jgi:DNA gyrase subunit A